MRKIRIAFIISNLGQGGAEKQLITLINNLNSRKFDVKLFLYAAQKEPFYKQEMERNSINTKYNRLKRKFIPLKIFEAILFIRENLIVEKYDLIVSTLFMNNLLVRIAAPTYYKNRIICLMRTSLKNYNILYIIIEKIFASNSYTIFNSKKALNEFSSVVPKFRDRMYHVYNGFETNIRTDEKNMKSLVLGSLGRFSNEKNILQTIRAFQIINRTDPNVKLIVQGQYGNQYPKIIKEIKSNDIEVREKDPEIEKFYNDIRILILPSKFEGCPNVLFEALIRKKICIVSANANSDKFIKNAKNGFVYDGSDRGLVNAINSAISIVNTNAEDDIHQRGFDYVSKSFSIPKMIQNFERIFLEIYEKNKGGRFSANNTTI